MSTTNPYPIYPSILAFDFARLGEQVTALAAAGAAAFHFDIMDWHFVPNLTFGPLVLQAVRKVTDLPLNAHLMVENPERYLEGLVKAGANRVYVHPESTPQIHRIVDSVRRCGFEVGVAINPGTPMVMLEPLLPLVAGVLVMSVDPGFGGQAFLPATYSRLAQLTALMQQLGVSPEIEVDGGVDAGNIQALAQAGMTGAVVGSALFADGDPVATLRRIQQAAG